MRPDHIFAHEKIVSEPNDLKRNTFIAILKHNLPDSEIQVLESRKVYNILYLRCYS